MEPICRACLSSDSRTFSCFDDSFINYYNLLTNLSVESNDGLPQNLCYDCWSTIQAFITFREKCIASDNTLKIKLINSLKSDVDFTFSLEDSNIKKEALSESGSNFDDDINIEHYSDIKPTLQSDENETHIVTDEKISSTIKTREKGRKTKPNVKKNKKDNKSIYCNRLSKLKKFDCGLCKKVFKLRERLINHLNSHKSNLVCLICKKDDFISWQALIAHRFNHIDNDEKYCHMCNQKFTFEGSMMHHYLYSHMAEGEKKPTEFECVYCFRLYSSIRKLDRHISNQHSGNNFICDHCGSSFTSKSIIVTHMLHIHNTSLQYKCKVCKSKFKTWLTLRNHTLRVHGGDGGKKFYCSKCTRYFISEIKLNNHVCGGLKTVICQVCGLTLKKRRYNMHMRSHLNKKYECQLCPTKLISRGAFKVHMDKHKGIPSYKCPYCTKEFYAAANLLIHKRIHTGEKPYVCQFCGKGFPKNHNLKVHMKVHGLNLVQKKNAVDETKDTK